MKRKFVILNNGLRDHRGHYFETSIAIAEAARRAGLHPILATHVDCRSDLLPMWLESYPMFCTDHWMSEPPADPPDLSGLGGAAEAPPGAGRRLLSALLRRTARVCRKAAWGVDRSVYYFLPPFVYDGIGLLFRSCVPRIVLPQYRDRVRGRSRQIISRWLNGGQCPAADFGPCPPEIARSLRQRVECPYVARALAVLRDVNLVSELEYALIFKRDLERLLAMSGVGPDDHVLLGTAHAREILAVQLVVAQLGAERAPTFHLEFRHSLYKGEPVQEELEPSQILRLYRACFTLYEQGGRSPKIKFYTDTEELARDYGRVGKMPFGVLPIPFRSELIANPRMPGQALRLAFLGEARDEKGFHWLPQLIDRLMDDYLLPGRARFLLQANVSAPQFNPLSSQVVARLRRYSAEHVELFGLDAPLDPDEYYSLVSRADVVLLPYDRDRYRACSSGALAEAVAAGRPAVVPASSWLSSQIPLGAGETFHDFESFVEAVKRVIDDYDAYRSRAEAIRSDWAARHSPDRLVAEVAGVAREESRSERVAA